MHQRRRPTGTDDPDLAYATVLDNSIAKITQGRSRLSELISVQARYLLLMAANITMSTMTMKDGNMNRSGIFAVIFGFLSLVIGELGRKHNRIGFLELFLVGSTISTVLSYVSISRHLHSLEALSDLSNLVNSIVQVFAIVTIILDSLVQVKLVTTTILLIGDIHEAPEYVITMLLFMA